MEFVSQKLRLPGLVSGENAGVADGSENVFVRKNMKAQVLFVLVKHRTTSYYFCYVCKIHW